MLISTALIYIYMRGERWRRAPQLLPLVAQMTTKVSGSKKDPVELQVLHLRE